MDVDNFGGDAFLLQFVSCFESRIYQMSCGYNAHILAFVHHNGFANHKFLVGRGEVGYFGAAKTEIYGAYVFSGGNGGGFGLVVVAGVDDHHVGQPFHQAYVLHNLVGGTILAYGDAGVGACNLDVEVGIGHGHADLVIHTAGDKAGECACKRYLATDSQAGGDADHIGFCDARLDETLGMGFLEVSHLQTAGHIGTEGENTRIFLTSF